MQSLLKELDWYSWKATLFVANALDSRACVVVSLLYVIKHSLINYCMYCYIFE